MPKKKFKYRSYPKSKHHFFASNFAEWKVKTSYDELVAFMKSAGYNFTIYFVPCHINDEYKIDQFMPQHPGTIMLGCYEVEE